MKHLPISLFWICVCGCAPALIIESEQEAIRSVWDASISAALDGDYHGWSAAFSDDVEIVSPTLGQRLRGKRSVESVYRPVFQGDGPYSDIKTLRFDVQIDPTGKMAWGTAEVEITAQGVQQTTWFALVYRKEADGWKMVLGFNVNTD